MLDKISIKRMSNDERIFLLKELGLGSDGIYALDEKGEKIIDEYIDQPVRIDNMLILPGSTIIIDNNPLSIAGYMGDYPDVNL